MSLITVATVQFENRSGDKAYNLAKIEEFAGRAKAAGARVVAFHECSVTGYTFARKLSKEELTDLAEEIPDGQSVRELIRIASVYDIAICAGLFEREGDGDLYKAYICVDKNGLIAKFRKLHPFINPHLKPGSSYCVFDLYGWKCGILICYDNNIMENVRATKLLGAEIIFMPHVTMCTPSTRPGAGFVDPALWEKRHTDPTSLRLEFEGMKGRDWLMKWLPARAYDNAVYCIFSNPIGMDDDQLKNGRSMIIDPFGDVVAECTELDESLVTACLTKEKLQLAGGSRYIKARRPALYKEILGQDHQSFQSVSWLKC
ncbi:nitrilase family protein [Terrimonas sp. NA20]|uniref:Nitrilase family protein n=1 Tax=Terrimonas ginsenosidimutans TaxID=2908004 RepID=A0ABS9KWQ6_9BACT|nr:nitrilase family protein [Terrimonas ginsenosidimutans]MCG2616751.1 nitrilase family protein [Terrimonas ginsenosidimutans]